MNKPTTKVINGSYLGNPATHYYGLITELNVLVDSSGDFVSGWKLNPMQSDYLTTKGKFGGY